MTVFTNDSSAPSPAVTPANPAVFRVDRSPHTITAVKLPMKACANVHAARDRMFSQFRAFQFNVYLISYRTRSPVGASPGSKIPTFLNVSVVTILIDFPGTFRSYSPTIAEDELSTSYVSVTPR